MFLLVHSTTMCSRKCFVDTAEHSHRMTSNRHPTRRETHTRFRPASLNYNSARSHRQQPPPAPPPVNTNKSGSVMLKCEVCLLWPENEKAQKETTNRANCKLRSHMSCRCFCVSTMAPSPRYSRGLTPSPQHAEGNTLADRT